jgi:hypothetical protein
LGNPKHSLSFNIAAGFDSRFARGTVFRRFERRNGHKSKICRLAGTQFLPARLIRFRMARRNLTLFALLVTYLAHPASSRAQEAAPSPLTTKSTTAQAEQDAPQAVLSADHDLKISASDAVIVAPKPLKLPDLNDNIYYRNKLEFSLDTGALPINIPFVFDIFVGGDYSQKPLRYTLVPTFASIRWHMGKINGPPILRGNTDMIASLSLTAIPRGPEKIYGAFNLGFRRNFVPRNWKATPYFEVRMGAGGIDAKGPSGNFYAQGQDFTFTLWLGAGVRYNFNQKYSMSLGPAYMHVSNAYLSEPKYLDNGINVTGGIIGFNMRLGKPKEFAR